MKITNVEFTPIAFDDPPLLNAAGVHEPLALRTIIRLEVGEIVGWGETWGGVIPAAAVPALREALLGMNVFASNSIQFRVETVLAEFDAAYQRQDRLVGHSSHAPAAFAGLETACLDAQGKLVGLPVVDLLGGAMRDRVDFSAYLFFKWGAHLDGQAPDRWGEALDAEGIVRQARKFVDEYGFRSIKLKAGIMPPDTEIAAIHALAREFPELPLRIDPNAAWSLDTALRAAADFDGMLEYYEDPVAGIEGMARVHSETGLTMATNMVVSDLADLEQAARTGAIQVLLSDHHVWGGLRHTQELAVACKALGLGVSMHSNSHLGISLAAMTHVAAAIPNLTYACDTHYPWNSADDIVRPGALNFVDGAVAVPTGPGLGVEVDENKLDELHRRFVASGRTIRDDQGYMLRADPDFVTTMPRY